MASPLQHQTTTQFTGLPTSSTRGHRLIARKDRHELTFKPDQSDRAGHAHFVTADKTGTGGWAALDFLSHVLFGSELSDGSLLQSVKTVVTNPALFDKSQFSNMDWYHWCDLVEKLINVGAINSEFRVELVDFIMSVTSVSEYSVQLAFDDYAQKILRQLISDSPGLIWDKYHEMRADPDAMSIYRLDSLFGAGVGEPSKPGVLNDVPVEIYELWMLKDKDERIPFILDWIQLFDGSNEARSWSPAFVSFVDAHVDHPSRLNHLNRRLTTGTWWGSYANKLEAERDRLLQLRELSQNPHVHRWIEDTAYRMERQITDERRRDANREASYRA